MYTKTESDEKYVPVRAEFQNSLSVVSNINGVFNIINYSSSEYANPTGGELYVDNDGVSMLFGDYGIVVNDHGPQMVINDDLHRLLIDTDLPTAISTSDLNTILV